MEKAQWFGARIRGKIHSHGIVFLYFDYVNQYLLCNPKINVIECL